MNAVLPLPVLDTALQPVALLSESKVFPASPLKQMKRWCMGALSPHKAQHALRPVWHVASAMSEHVQLQL